jgi:putative phosphoribosyl transferase
MRAPTAVHTAPVPVEIRLDGIAIYGDLQLPAEARGLVIFVHGSGSSRFSARNRYVADQLNNHGMGTLLLDLLTKREQEIDEQTMQFRFDIPMLARRSTLAARWAMIQADLGQLPIGLFGASTGAASALITAATLKDRIAAVVSRGGRPDLAEGALEKVEAPTLLIVGGEDPAVLDLNQRATRRMHCLKRLHVVPGATHLFEEPGALEQVATIAAEWFVEHLRRRPSAAPDHGLVSGTASM